MAPRTVRNLMLVLGDQLNRDSAAFDGFDPRHDAVWMAENHAEATHVWCHKARLVLFFSAMRHFREALRAEGLRVEYHELSADPARDRGADFAGILAADVARLAPQRLVVVQPGDWRVLRMLEQAAADLGLPLEVRGDRHFLCTPEAFREHAAGRRELVMEFFYRWMRREHGILLDADGRPEGGEWNHDKDNRESFGKAGPRSLPRVPRFGPDTLTREVIALVEARFAAHPGSVASFAMPVTPADARAALDDFVAHRLPLFGRYEDAMWGGAPFLYHSLLSAPLNLKLLDPRACIEAAVDAWRRGAAPINAVEGFVRQVLGWREFVRGVYWLHMPGYAAMNALGHEGGVPSFLWDGDTRMECVRQAMATVLEHGYAHHIQRLMVLGQYALLSGVHPLRFHEWHMAMYVDAVDWVSLPNALGMSQYGDGGIVGTKPYCASGKYIDRMSNHCRHCPYDPAAATGADACPFTTLYWDFLDRHAGRLGSNRRMGMQFRNLERMAREDPDRLAAIRARAEGLKSGKLRP